MEFAALRPNCFLLLQTLSRSHRRSVLLGSCDGNRNGLRLYLRSRLGSLMLHLVDSTQFSIASPRFNEDIEPLFKFVICLEKDHNSLSSSLLGLNMNEVLSLAALSLFERALLQIELVTILRLAYNVSYSATFLLFVLEDAGLSDLGIPLHPVGFALENHSAFHRVALDRSGVHL